jgi:hypothetical protein
MEKMVAFAVNIGNLGRTGRPRFTMGEWVRGLNDTFRARNAGLRLLDFFGHTGNFVVASELERGDTAEQLAGLLHTPCAVVSLNTVKRGVRAANVLAPPDPEPGIRWTPGLVFSTSAFLVAGALPISLKAVFRPHDSAILAWKRDQLDRRGRLDKTRRAGGWGAVSSAIARHLGGTWTARSISTVGGVLSRAEEAGGA